MNSAYLHGVKDTFECTTGGVANTKPNRPGIDVQTPGANHLPSLSPSNAERIEGMG